MTVKKEIRKILLIMPPATISPEYTKEIQPPLGLAYIAACLETSYDVRILDAACLGWHTERKEDDGRITYGLSLDSIKEIIADYKPDAVGVSCLFTMQRKNAHAVCRAAKEADKTLITFMGGAHPTALPELTLEDPNVDIVILGEGDFTTKEVLGAINAGQELSSINGIAYKGNGKIHNNPKTKFIEDIDQIPFPARHLLPMEQYFKINLPHGVSTRHTPNTPLITSRGCPANCIFCSIHGVWGYKYRARSVDNIIAELELLKNHYGVKEVQFEDDNLTFDRKRAIALFDKMIEKKLDLAWTTPNGVAMWSLDREVLRKMRQSGCYRVCLAIESGDQKFLAETIHKPLNLNKAKELMKDINDLGFESDAFFVVGFPTETKEQLANTFKFAGQLKSHNVTFYLATPYPGTELYKMCQQIHCLSPDFSLDDLGVKKSTIIPKNFSQGQLERLIASHTLKHKISLLWRNPAIFYYKIIHRFFRSPKQFISLVGKYLKNILPGKKT